jgi:hypothetical protein
MHYYERNIADIKNEYTDFLIHIISPLIYEGIKSMYKKAVETDLKFKEMSKQNINVNNPGTLKLFQHFLKNIPTLNINLIESEMIRIRDSSKHADIFEKLIKAVIKSNIILLTFNASGKKCKIVNEKFHEKIDIKMFIHKIYIEAARQIYNNPELFWHEFPTVEIKRNQRICIDIINKAINVAIKEILPMADILAEYLRNDYIEETDETKLNNIKHMMNQNAEDNINYFDEGDKKVLITEENVIEENYNNINNADNDAIQTNINDIENLLNDNNINANNNPSINSEEYKSKLNNINQNTFNSRTNSRINSRINNNIQQHNPISESKLEGPQGGENKQIQNTQIQNKQIQNTQIQPQLTENIDENNINIVKNNINDNDNYINAFFN